MKKSFKESFSEIYKTLLSDFQNSLKSGLPNFYTGFVNLKLRFSEALKPLPANEQSHPVVNFLISNKKIWIGIFLSIFMLFLLTLVVRPYSLEAYNQLSLNHSQSDHLKKLIVESQSISNKTNLVGVFNDQELAKFKQLLLSKGIKPNQLAFNSSDGIDIQIQLNQVAFAPFLDLINEVREIWHLYPVQMSVVATNSPGIVNIDAKLMQFRHEPTNSSSSLVSN
jgi:type II secretory pathway component PulM